MHAEGSELVLLQTWALSTDIGLVSTEETSGSAYLPVVESEQDVFDMAVRAAFLPSNPATLDATVAKACLSFPKSSKEICFDPVNKYSGRSRKRMDGWEVMVLKGAAESILAMSANVFISDGNNPLEGDLTSILDRAVPLTTSTRTSLQNLLIASATRGRFLAYAVRFSPPSSSTATDPASLTFIGGFIFHDPIRPEVSTAIADCQALGINVMMCTGDHPASAKIVAQDAGIEMGDAIIVGKEIDMMEDQLEQAIERANVFARYLLVDMLIGHS